MKGKLFNHVLFLSAVIPIIFYLLSFTSVKVSSKMSILKTKQDTLTIILSFNRPEVDIDDVRWGDAELCYDPQNYCFAVEEIEHYFNCLLTQKIPTFNNLAIDGKYDDSLATAILQFRDWFKTIYDSSIDKNDQGRSWTKQDQNALEHSINDNIDSLYQAASDSLTRALLKYIKAELCRESGDHITAINLYQEIIQDFRSSRYAARAQGRIGFIKYKTKKFREAIANYESVCHNYPGSRTARDALYFIGKSYHCIGENNIAINFFDQLLSNDPDNKWAESALYFRSYSKLLMTNYDNAQSDFTNFISSYPNSSYYSWARYYHVKLYYLKEEFDAAITELNNYITTEPQARIKDAYYLLDRCYWEKGYRGETDLALSHFDQIINAPDAELERFYWSYKFSWMLYEKTGDSTRAEQLKNEYKTNFPQKCQEALIRAVTDKEKAYAHYWLAVFYIHENEYIKSNEQLDLIIGLNDYKVDKAHYMKARNYESLREFDTALAGYRETVNKFPDSEESTKAMFGIGRVLSLKHHYRYAIAELIKFRENYPNSRYEPQSHLISAYCYLKMADTLSAKNEYLTILSKYPNNWEIARFATAYLERLDQPH